ncbi:aminotransferase class I/II-fold pyridoxal phosphate-dependent enzyme, partial [Nocardia sp. NPDC060220]
IPVTRVILQRPYTLDPTLVPEHADLVVLGNPTNPTSVLHSAQTIQALRRPGRTIVVDEAFTDAVVGRRAPSGIADERTSCSSSFGGACVDGDPAPDGHLLGDVVSGEAESLAGLSAPDVIVLRSLTKTWALAGLRCGYALGAPEVLARLAHGRPHWPLGTLQLEAIIATAEPAAVAESQRYAARIAVDRTAMIDRLTALGLDVHTPATGPFLLLRARDGALLRKRLADRGVAVRRADTFPGLGPDHLRVAVRGAAEVDGLIDALNAALW